MATVSTSAEKANGNGRVIYGLDDIPKPFTRAFFLGLQHVLTMFGATVAVPLLLGPAMGFNAEEIALLVSSVMIASGVATALQVNLGTRLPIIQGVSFAFLGPFFAIIGVHGKASMPYIAGAIIVGGIIEAIVGYTGLIGKLKKIISPIVIGPVIALIGLSLWGVAAPQAGLNWWLGGMTVVLAFLFGLVLAPKNRFFQMFPILLAVVTTYTVALIASVTGLMSPDTPGYISFAAVANAPWFRYDFWNIGEGGLIFPWGWPKFTLAFIIATLAGYLSSMIESFGDYHTISYVSTGKDPTVEQINKGIGAEGVACIGTAIFGGFASTSYTENIGLVTMTRVASRYVTNIAAVLLIFLGLFSKFGALVATIPAPIVGGLYMTLFGLIASVGLSALMKADMNSHRNQMIVGFSLFMGLSLPAYFTGVPWLGYQSQTITISGAQWLGDIIQIIGSTGMAVAAIFGLLLDNLIPGTPEERGLIER